MPELSRLSKERLSSCHEDIQLFVNKLAEKWKLQVICGYRDKINQDKVFREGKSKLQWPHSLHNKSIGGFPCSYAVDIAPLKVDQNGITIIDWEDIQLFREMAATGKLIIDDLYRTGKISNRIDWGPDIFPANFPDYPHWQIRK